MYSYLLFLWLTSILLSGCDDKSIAIETEADPVQGEVLVIMPLGDSLTNDSRPRVTLWNLLTEDGYLPDYVGDQYQTSSIPDPNHEGVGGETIQGIKDKAERLMNTHKPEYVLLMIGTNDIAWYFDETGDEIADQWNSLIELILSSSEPGTYIVAATIPPLSSNIVGKSGMEIRDRAVLAQQFNSELRKYIAARKGNGENIILADVEAALNPEYHLSGDGVHLNDDGYTIMGTVYYHAMSEVLSGQ